MLNNEASRAPNLPQVAQPIAWRRLWSRSVMRAHGSTKVGRRSAKILRGQRGLRQKNLRVVRCRTTDWPPQGVSRSVLLY